MLFLVHLLVRYEYFTPFYHFGQFNFSFELLEKKYNHTKLYFNYLQFFSSIFVFLLQPIPPGQFSLGLPDLHKYLSDDEQ